MTTPAMVALMQGALAGGYAVAGLFFLKFWARTRDRLFAMFAASFWLLAVHRVLAVAFASAADDTWLYVIRLVAFLTILFAIIDKNRGHS